MRTVFSLIAVSVIAFNAHGASPPDEARRKAELQEAVDRFGRAYLEADVPALRLLLADNYVHVNGSSGNVLNRSDWLDWVRSRRAQIDNEELQITEYRVENVESVIHGDTAIVIGTEFFESAYGWRIHNVANSFHKHLALPRCEVAQGVIS